MVKSPARTSPAMLVRPTRRTASALVVAAAAAALAAGAVPPQRGGMRNFHFRSGSKYRLSADAVSGEFCDPNSPLSFSGYFGVEGSEYDDSGSKRYFYWFFEKRSNSLLTENEQNRTDVENVPFVVWLNGGPGCSSLLGLLTENGPCLVNEDGDSTRINDYSWTEAAHVLFLDQPANVGYSYGEGNDDDEDMVAEDAYYFLQSFFRSAKGEKYKDLPLYLTGESFAGHYLPAIAHRIATGNKNKNHHNHAEGDLLHLSLAGVAIGNGFIDQEEQMKWYADMAFKNPHDIKIVDDEDEYEQMKEAAEHCARDAHACKHATEGLHKEFLCQKAAGCEGIFFRPLDQKNISVYDISKPCIGPLCEDMTPITTFLNLNTTKEALNVPLDVTWKDCDDRVSLRWSDTDWVANFAPYISELLDDGIPVLIYSGDLDYICNYMGNRAVALKLEWKHGDDFRSAEDHDWNDRGGLARSSHNLAFLQVYNAGHMVPQDQPEQALAMIRQFLNGEPF